MALPEELLYLVLLVLRQVYVVLLESQQEPLEVALCPRRVVRVLFQDLVDPVTDVELAADGAVVRLDHVSDLLAAGYLD